MVWKDFCLGIATTLSAQFVLALVIVAVAILKSERATKKLLGKMRND